MNAELTAENRPACARPSSVSSTTYGKQGAHEDEGSIQVLVVLARIIPVKLSGFPAVHGANIGSRVIGPRGIE